MAAPRIEIRLENSPSDDGVYLGMDGLHHCKKCGKRVERYVEFPKMDGSGQREKRLVGVMCECRIMEENKKSRELNHMDTMARIDKLKKLSLIDSRLKNAGFGSYRVCQENKRQFQIARQYVEKFPEMAKKHQGLLFHGDVGTGKSYTAAAIANELLDRQYSVVMTSFIKLLADAGSMKEKEDHFNAMNSAELLIIDDLGAERGTDYALEQVYNFVDTRYRTGRPLILTTNLSLSDMKLETDIRYNRIYDRIFEMCYPVKFAGISWRKRSAASRYDDVRAMLEAELDG